MLITHQTKYNSWSDAEIHKLIDASNIHKNVVINWDEVASHFPNRTTQQCKSFYNNRIKPLENTTDVYNYYLFMISTQMQKPRTHQQNVKKLFCECGTADMYIHIANLLVDNSEFRFNYKFLSIMKQIIEIHCLLREDLTVAFSIQKYIEFGEYTLSKDLYDIMIGRMNSFDITTCIQKIEARL
ncbi:Myb-like_DNA-binding domain-containing protein [Hexamita inflata]|uniref:Myb-like DNA-binding domain-containing protein n=1 Tax=Hexamita inflata TaxID=28002 RepID=A0AA86R6A2_9EUKA|nr:Myb-like DNA-binding domain-containing protein [Hexamita inflata]CAI9925583.1 Myb-like DNA-binding domain-containing protein [Hexamita inflata]CAI9966724.1 Myb-like DNA-binding domain-containing protein [Hexamita inflata]CAI9966727.1 Myb-like DNA-binding domain-containing protein [Hexamita inflata]